MINSTTIILPRLMEWLTQFRPDNDCPDKGEIIYMSLYIPTIMLTGGKPIF